MLSTVVSPKVNCGICLGAYAQYLHVRPSTHALSLSPLQPSIASSVPALTPLTPPAPKISHLPRAAQRDVALGHVLKYLTRYKVSTADLLLHIFSGSSAVPRMIQGKDVNLAFFVDGTALETLLDRLQQYARQIVSGIGWARRASPFLRGKL